MILLAAITTVSSSFAANNDQIADNDYVFESDLFRGGPLNGIDLHRFSKANSVVPGSYKVELFVNGRFVDRADVLFADIADAGVQPCLPVSLLKAAGIGLAVPKGRSEGGAAKTVDMADETGCLAPSEIADGATAHMDMGQLRLDLSVPQASMVRLPRGYVSPSELDPGSSVGFVNYMGNYYHLSNNSGDYSSSDDSAYLSLNGGVNFGLWQYRQQSNLSYDEHQGTRWRSIRSYLQRPMDGIGSELTMGQTYTSGRFFSGLAFSGVNIASDDRMLPDSQRGYAPVVRGVARTNARVSVRQNGQEIYQTTVAPGPFEISDLYPTSFNGDLDVQVTEADGSVSQFSVPFSAVPESLRPGTSKYDLSIGRTRNAGDDAVFGDLTYQYGVSNGITGNSGVRVSDGYQAFVLGGVYNSWLGAFGLDATYSRADMPDTGYVDGWMSHLSYSRTFQPTATTISIAGYRYSTRGYRDLGDVLGVRGADQNGYSYQSTTYQQRSRFEVSLSQQVTANGNLFVTGSTQDYRDGRERDTQYQAGYSTSFGNGLNMSLSVSRQRIGGYDSSLPGGYVPNQGNSLPDPNYNDDGYYSGHIPGEVETTTMLSISFPLGSASNAHVPIVNASYSHDSQTGGQYQTTLTGLAEEDNSLSYNLGVSDAEQQSEAAWNAGLQKTFPKVSVGLNGSRGADYWQAAVNAQGALALHSGGVTFGPYLGDTFGIIEAKGAEGAKVLNAQNATIDSHGYALIPALTPYRYNSVALDPEGMSSKAELEDGEKRVAPYAGAAVKISFKTRSGSAVLIHTQLNNGESAPMGAEVYDEGGSVVGMVGQAGQVYARVEKNKGTLNLRWGDGKGERCTLPYDISRENTDQPLIKLEQKCSD